jgi:hypothetical protein
MTMLVNLDHNRDNRWVKLKRSLLQHREHGTLKTASFHVMVTALAICGCPDRHSEVHRRRHGRFRRVSDQKADLRRHDAVVREKVSYEASRWRDQEHGHKVRISNFEITEGPNAGKRTPHRLTAKSKNEANFQENLVTFEGVER